MPRDATPKQPPSPLAELRDVLARVTTATATAVQARDAARLDLAALDDAEARRTLTEQYRSERKQAIRTEAQKAIRRDAEQALALVNATVAQRDHLTGKAALLQRARFLEPLPMVAGDGSDFYDANRHRQMVNALRDVQDELRRSRVRAELMDAPPAQLAQAINMAAAAGDLATLAIAQRVVDARKQSDFDGTAEARQALLVALDRVQLPDDVQALDGVFDELEQTAARLEAITAEADGAFVHEHDLTERVQLATALTAEHGSERGAIAYAEARQAQRADRAKEVQERTRRVVKDAIRTNGTTEAA